MSAKHPIIAITGSSGAGTSTVMRTFVNIFRREGVKAVLVEGDSFHAYDRAAMRQKMAEEEAKGNRHFSHFGPEANLFGELENLFKTYSETGRGRIRHYVHNVGSQTVRRCSRLLHRLGRDSRRHRSALL